MKRPGNRPHIKASASGATPAKDRRSSTNWRRSRPQARHCCTAKTPCPPCPAPASGIAEPRRYRCGIEEKPSDDEVSESPAETTAYRAPERCWAAVQISNERDPSNRRWICHRRAAGVLRANGARGHSVDRHRKSFRVTASEVGGSAGRDRY